MSEVKELHLSLNGDTFASLKTDFDNILANTIRKMEKKGADEATITLKLSVSLTKESDSSDEEITKPNFKHEISSVMQIKDKKTGSMSGEHKLVWDEEKQEYVLVAIGGEQMTMFDNIETESADEIVSELRELYPAEENARILPPPPIEIEIEETEDAVEEEDDEEEPGVDTPYGWLKQFVGTPMNITEAMGNYTVRAGKKIILSTATAKTNPFYCDKEILAKHCGHNIECVCGGKNEKIIIGCSDCGDILFSLSAKSESKEENDDMEYEEPEN